MLFRLICLYQNGVALAREELLTLPPHIGHLVLEDWGRRNRFSTFNWRARLLDLEIKSGPRDVVPPLYNPCVVKMPDMQDLQMTLYGYERQFESEHVIVHVQYWVLFPLPLKKDMTKKNPMLV